MTVVGIIAEFNPFHKGHEYIITEAKRLTGADYCVVVMSGDFVQRGAPAVCDKFMRTRMALNGGVDAVFELPVPFATASAEIFAEAGVRMLASLGCIDCIAFGSECGDIDILMKCAAVLTEEPAEYREALSKELKLGASFPVARAAALRSVTGDEALLAAINSPNNILGVEYCKAVLRLRAQFKGAKVPTPVTIKRLGSDYNDNTVTASDFASASAIRSILEKTALAPDAGRPAIGSGISGDSVFSDLFELLPPYTANTIAAECGKSLPVTADDLSDMLHIRLATIAPEDLFSSADVSRDFGNAIRNISDPVPAASFTRMCELLKTKNTTYSSVSRALLHIVLGIDNSFVTRMRSADSIFPYVRLLGFKTASSAILHAACATPGCRLITKLADARTVAEPGSLFADLFNADVRAGSVYSQLVFSRFWGSDIPKSEFQREIIRL